MEENFATRVQQQYDENGNPLYDSLRNDVAEFNNQQMEELLATLPPGKVRDEVIYRLRELDHDLQMKTVPITEGWKGEFVKAQGNNEINDLVKTYVTEADRPMGDFDAAFDAITSKYPSSFSSEELKSMREKARSGAAAGRYEVIINSSIHSNDGETLKKVYNDIEHDPYVSQSRYALFPSHDSPAIISSRYRRKVVKKRQLVKNLHLKRWSQMNQMIWSNCYGGFGPLFLWII